MTREYNARYESWYNVTTDEWLESKCSNPDCKYCKGRPARPSEVELLTNKE